LYFISIFSAEAPIFYVSPKLTHIPQRRHSQSILNQLNALFSTHQTLTSNHNIRQEEIVSTQRELDAAKQELAGVNEHNQKKQQEHNVELEQLGSVRMELKAEREERKHKMASVRARLVELGTKCVFLSITFHFVDMLRENPATDNYKRHPTLSSFHTTLHKHC
jgi:predicted nuclease with TOPRIM domain